jgi:hypothetical protein
MAKSRSAFDYVLACDCETTGIAFGSVDPTGSQDCDNEEYFQAISFGFIVASATTFKPIAELYVEIQHDDRYVWNDGAEKVHGLSREYLAANGMSRKDAAFKIAAFIEKYFGPIQDIRKICLLGHNVATFDRYFLIELLQEFDLCPQFGNRHIDTFSLGVTLMGCCSSDELFDTLGLERDPNNHNALEDTKHALKAARLMKQFFNQVQ